MNLAEVVHVAVLFFSTTMAAGQQVPEPPLARVTATDGGRTMVLRGDLRPYQQVDLYARVDGFVERVLVDRGSPVRTGQELFVLSAPELDARAAESAAQVQVAAARLAEARAKLLAVEGLDAKVREAAATPGVVSGKELLQRREEAQAARAVVASAEAALVASRAAADATAQTRAYLRLTAPFAGVVTERLVHPRGAGRSLIHPGASARAGHPPAPRGTGA